MCVCVCVCVCVGGWVWVGVGDDHIRAMQYLGRMYTLAEMAFQML